MNYPDYKSKKNCFQPKSLSANKLQLRKLKNKKLFLFLQYQAHITKITFKTLSKLSREIHTWIIHKILVSTFLPRSRGRSIVDYTSYELSRLRNGFGGSRGIQTPDTRKGVYQISSLAHSVTLPYFLIKKESTLVVNSNAKVMNYSVTTKIIHYFLHLY